MAAGYCRKVRTAGVEFGDLFVTEPAGDEVKVGIGSAALDDGVEVAGLFQVAQYVAGLTHLQAGALGDPVDAGPADAVLVSAVGEGEEDDEIGAAVVGVIPDAIHCDE